MSQKWKLPLQLLAVTKNTVRGFLINSLRAIAQKRSTIAWRPYALGFALLLVVGSITFLINQLPPRAPSFKSLDGEIYQFQAKNKLFSSKLGIREEKPIVAFSLPSGESLVFSYAEATENPTLKSSTSKNLMFSQVETGVDLHYETLANGLKEEIILQQPRQKTEDTHVFTFDSTFTGAYPKEIIAGFASPVFYDENSEYLFHFEKPFAIDAAGNRTDAVILQIEDKNTSKIPELKRSAQQEMSYTIRLTVDEAWLTDPSRVYPIKIDPTIIHDENSEFATGSLNRSNDTRSTHMPGATGGTITNANGYTTHTFTSSGTFTPTRSMNVEVLVVGGGGGGGACRGGGGGGGGVVYSSSLAVTSQAYTVTVGNGGTGATVDTNSGNNGGNSSFSTLTAIGGGGGASNSSNGPSYAGSNGGSGGGGVLWGLNNGGLGTSGQGNNGGGQTASYLTNTGGGGGGGAGAVGANSSNNNAGNGGIGLPYSISGNLTYYAGGGGGSTDFFTGSTATAGIGGDGGGGNGGVGTVGNGWVGVGSNGTANTGGGGGGGTRNSSSGACASGGNGGSGVVIIKYLNQTTLESYYPELSSDTNTLGLWHLNDTDATVTDSSGNNSAGSATGTTIIDGILGKARSFNGSSDYLTTNLSKGKNNFTIEMWVKPNATHEIDTEANSGTTGTSGQKYAYWNGGWTTSSDAGALISVGTNGVSVYEHTGGYMPPLLVYSGTINGWTHIAIAYEERTPSLYINGNFIKKGLTSGKSNVYPYANGGWSETNLFKIGGGAYGYFGGEIDEVRVSNVTRTPEEIKQAATRAPYSTYTSPVLDLTGVNAWNSFSWSELGINTGNGETLKDATSLVAQWNFNETSGTTATNNAGSCGASCNGTLTSFASTASQDQAAGTGWTSNNRRWGAGALMFDGVDDFVSVPDNNALSFGNAGTDSPFTIEAWVFPEFLAGTGDGNWIVNKRNATAADEYQFVIYEKSVWFGVFSGTANYMGKRSTKTLEPGMWYHIVGTYDGSETLEGLKIYVNGIEQTTTTSTVGTYTGMSNGSNPLIVGKGGWSSGLEFDGTIDSIRIYARTLTPAEILSNYQTGNIELQTRVGTSATPNATDWEEWRPLTTEDILQSFETSLTDSLTTYWKLDETSGTRKDSHGKHTLTSNGTGGVGSATGRINYGADFESTESDYLEIADTSSLPNGDTNFTISTWVYLESKPGVMELVTKYGTDTTDREFRLFYLDSSDVFRFVIYDNNGSAITGINNSSVNPATGTWYHVVAYHDADNNQLGLAINGTLATNNTSGAPVDTSSSLLIGARGSTVKTAYFDGIIDEVAIWNRVLTSNEISQLYQNGNNKKLIDGTDLLNKQDYGGIKLSSSQTTKTVGSGANKISTGKSHIKSSTGGIWTLDETGGTGAYVKDSSGNANHGTPTGTSYAKGKIGGARDFDGVDDQIDIGDVTFADGATELTISAWIKPDSLPSSGEYNTIVSKADFTAGGNAFFVRLNGSEGIRFAVRDASSNQINCDTGKLPDIGVWTYITAVLDANDTCYVYYNGNLQFRKIDSSFTTVQNTSTTLKIGGSDYVSENYFDGLIDEVSISTFASSEQEVSNAYKMARDNYLDIGINENLTTQKSLPFFIAADRPGQYLQASLGETAFANGQTDQNTLAFWKMDEDSQVFRETFSGTSLSTFWNEIDPASDKIAVNNGLTLTAGTAAAWDSAIVSTSLFTRSEGFTAYMRFTTGASVAAPNHMMFGIATNSTVTPSHTNINHALYFNAGAFYVYQNGSLTGGPYGSGYAANTTYEVRITLTPDGPASYAVKGGSYTDWTTLLSADTNLTNTNIRIQLAQYRHTGTVNEIAVYSPTVKAQDASGNNYHGNPGGVISSDGKVGKSTFFPGATSFINLGSVNIADSLANLTVDAWVFPTAQTGHARIFSKQHVLYIGQYADQVSFYMGTGAAWSVTETAGGTLKPNAWNHVAWVKSGTSYSIYINGQLVKSGTGAPATLGTNANTNFIGSFAASSQSWFGNIDELRISNVARSADDIRQAYEYGVGLRSHTITIDFAARLDNSNLIGNSGDTSFIVDATTYGLDQKGSKLFAGDKIIIRENYDGTEYIAQGDVESVGVSTGAVVVSAWDAGSTFPAGGFSENADVFKWQREYWPIDNRVLDSHLDSITNLTLRVSNGNEGRTIWLDDLRSSGDYLTNPAGSTITSDISNRYFQYRAIINSSDAYVSPSLSSVSLDYVANSIPNTPTLNTPADTAINQSPTPTLQTTGTDTDSDYLRYKIELCTNLGMTSNCQTFDQTSSQTGWSGQNTQTNTAYTSGSQASYTLQSELTPSMTYYWRSYAIDPSGTAIWSATQDTPHSFTTSALPSAPTDPQTEGLTNPSGVSDTTPEFSAIHNDTDGDAALHYEIEVNTASDFSGTVLWDSGQQSMTSTANGVRSPQISYAGTALTPNGATYYWRIRFFDSFGLTGVWSDTQTFTLNTPPEIPALNYPLTGSTNVAFIPTLQTTGTDTDSDYLRYKIELCTNLGMTSNCQTFDQTSSQTGWSGQNTQTNTAYTSGSQASYTLQSELTPNTTYYWRSYAIDPGGSVTWSSTQATPYNFVTRSSPMPASACLLQKNITNDQILITWTDNATNENNYEVQRSVNGGAWITLQTGMAANSTSLLDTSVSPDNTYQYRIAPYFTGPLYSEWCTASQLDLGIGNFKMEGLNLGGLHLN